MKVLKKHKQEKSSFGRPTSIYKGVVFVVRQQRYAGKTKVLNPNKRRKNWQATICRNLPLVPKQLHIGYYETQNEAALAYNNKAKEIYGENAFQNTIMNKPPYNSINSECFFHKLPKTKEDCINRILASENLENKHRIKKDNKIIIGFLNGENDLSELFTLYYKQYIYMVKSYMKNRGGKQVRGNKKSEFEKNSEDFVQEGFLLIMEAVSKFKYNGGSFRKWSQVVVRNTCASYFKQQSDKMKKSKYEYKAGTINYDEVWNSL